MRLRVAIFLDQMCRNVVAVQHADADDAAALKRRCDAAAVPLALSVLIEVGGPDAGANLLALGTPAELCFFSLILRHSRTKALIAISARILRSVSSALAGGAGPVLSAAERQQALDLCSRFVAETEDCALSLDVEAYLVRALSEDQPLALLGPPPLPSPRLGVLDAVCHGFAADGDVRFLEGLLNPATLLAFERHALVSELRASLGRLGLLTERSGLVLSLSGGVDSMVTNCLLWLVQRTLPPEQRFKWCALHLRHPNRDDAVDEEGWVRWVCDKLGVRLFTYRPQIRRPHGTLRTGISRERYEEKAKEIRFRMYKLCLQSLGADRGVAFVAHHQDDADENRLAELGKGNIVHIDGMSASLTVLGVEVIRPLLGVRKADLVRFAADASVCYMQDSTPKWSRRGWTRRLLDGFGTEDTAKHAQLLAALARAGAASELLGDALDASLRTFAAAGVTPQVLHVAPPAVPGKASKDDKAAKAAARVADDDAKALEMPIVILRMPEILRLAGDFETRLNNLRADFAEIAQVWNAVLDRQAASAAVREADGSPVGGRSEGLDAEADEDGDEDGADLVPSICPLQRITVCDAELEAGPFLLSRALAAASNGYAEVKSLLRGQLATRKSLTHLWDCVARARREYQWGTLHKRAPCLYGRDARCIVLFHSEGFERELADRRWQFSIAAAALALLGADV